MSLLTSILKKEKLFLGVPFIQKKALFYFLAFRSKSGLSRKVAKGRTKRMNERGGKGWIRNGRFLLSREQVSLLPHF